MKIDDRLLKNREKNSKIRIKDIVETQITNEIWTKERETKLDSSIAKVVLGDSSPYTLADEIIAHYKIDIREDD